MVSLEIFLNHSLIQYFDRATPDYETVLQPSDFELAAQMADSLQMADGDIWDSDAMYGKNKFEGDIANENVSLF